MNAASTFDLNARTYTSTNMLTFSGFENLTGGSYTDQFLINASVTFNLNGGNGADEFNFFGTSQLTGSINGGVGSDTLNYRDYAAIVEVDLANKIATAVSGGINSVENETGSRNYGTTI
jgi:acrosin